jgi:hypothetical protein
VASAGWEQRPRLRIDYMLHIPGGTVNGCGFAGGLGWNQWYFDCIQNKSKSKEAAR